jgi:hypothetical protein
LIIIIIMPFFLLKYLKIKLVVLPYLIQLVYGNPSRIITDFSTFVVNHNFKVSPSIRCVSAANDISKETDIFNKDKITLTDTL